MKRNYRMFRFAMIVLALFIARFNALAEVNVRAWGYGSFGQCNVPPDLTNAVTVAAGEQYSLAVTANGEVVSWGDPGFKPPNINNAVAVAASPCNSMALKADGTVIAWGRLSPGTDFGQTDVPLDLTSAVAISAGLFHGLALRADGTVVAWGDNRSGQCDVPFGLSNVVTIAAGYYHNLALKSDGTVVGWGLAGCYSPMPLSLTSAVAIAAADDHSLALKADGTVVAWWGFNPTNRWDPPPGLTNIVNISAGSFENLALKSDGTVISWGYNPTRVISGSRITAISAGGDHSLVLIGFGNQTEPTLSINRERVLEIVGGEIGSRYRLDYVNAIGSMNVWAFLRLITITGSPQFYSDTAASQQSSRFYRLVRVP